MDLTQAMWREFQMMGVLAHLPHLFPATYLPSPLPPPLPPAPLPVAMYNILLHVYHQNGHRFDPTHFLEMMERDGVQPNQVSLQYKRGH